MLNQEIQLILYYEGYAYSYTKLLSVFPYGPCVRRWNYLSYLYMEP